MNGQEIDEILYSYHSTKRYYLGNFPIDRLPRRPKAPYSIVINYDQVQEPGSHWCCIYADQYETHFHDSLGITPFRVEIVSFLDPENYTSTIKPLQHERSQACGPHVIAYIVKRSDGMSTLRYLEHFGSNRKENDNIVIDFVRVLKWEQIVSPS